MKKEIALETFMLKERTKKAFCSPHPEVLWQVLGNCVCVSLDPCKVVPLVDRVVGVALVVGEGDDALARAKEEGLA